jgi:hypothetical protein
LHVKLFDQHSPVQCSKETLRKNFMDASKKPGLWVETTTDKEVIQLFASRKIVGVQTRHMTLVSFATLLHVLETTRIAPKAWMQPLYHVNLPELFSNESTSAQPPTTTTPSPSLLARMHKRMAAARPVSTLNVKVAGSGSPPGSRLPLIAKGASAATMVGSRPQPAGKVAPSNPVAPPPSRFKSPLEYEDEGQAGADDGGVNSQFAFLKRPLENHTYSDEDIEETDFQVSILSLNYFSSRIMETDC